MSTPQITLHGLAETSLLVSVLIAIFLPLRPLLRRVVGSQWLCVLWLALVMRLLMPWPLESRLSLFNYWQNHVIPAGAAAAPLKIKVSVLEGDHAVNNQSAIRSNPASMAAQPADLNASALTIIWLAGAVLSLGALAWRWHQTRRLAAGTRPATDERLLHIFSSIPQQWRRNVGLRMTDALQVPTLAGVIRPQIWMPQSWPAQFTDDELRNVLLHELGHARRHDLLVQWLFAIAQCIHWFNPLAWFASRAARFDREMACDAWALARNDADHSGYGAALMKTVQLLRSPLRVSQGTIAMASDHRSLHVRISGIGTFRTTPAWRGIAVIGLAIAALAVTTTSRIAAQEKSGSTPPAPVYEVSPAPPLPQGAQGAPKTWGPQVEVKSDFFEISEADAKKLGLIDLISGMDAKQLGYKQTTGAPDEKPSAPGGGVLEKAAAEALLAKLNKASSVKLLSAPSVTTVSGQRAVVEIVREFRYPTEFEVDKKTGKATPTAFETRNTGITLEVEPAVTPKQEIRLILNPQIVTFLGFINYGQKPGDKPARTTPKADDIDSVNYSMENAQREAGSISQPVFSTRKMSTSVTLTSGQSVLLGGLRSELTKGRLIFFLLSATIVEPDAKTATPAPAAGSGN